MAHWWTLSERRMLHKRSGPLQVAACFALSLLANTAGQAGRSADRPNIVIVLVDDMGFSDLGCYGSEIRTPVLDRLAAHGVRFTQFYNTSRCCPTRAALLTGLYSHQAGVGHMTSDLGAPSYRGHLNDRCQTIGQVLGRAGYQTMAVGKWHVGSAPSYWPRKRGFDRYFGCPTGGGFYFRETMLRRGRFLVLDEQRTDFPEGRYITDLFTDYAVQFIKEASARERPFFLYLAHIAPHWPLQAKSRDIGRYAAKYQVGWDETRAARFARQRQLGLADGSWRLSPPHASVVPWKQLDTDKRKDMAHRMAVYAAQIDAIDQNVGRMVTLLSELEELDNTVFMVLSDNGCSAEGGPGGFRRGDREAPIGTAASFASAGLEWANVSDTPFRRFKSYVHEGGIATPLIVHWPAGIGQPNRWIHAVSHVIDLMPTCVELADARYPADVGGDLASVLPLEGSSLLAAIDGDRTPRPAPLFWEHQGNRAVREGDWKLVADHRGAWELYNLQEDRSELRNLAALEPEKVVHLAALWDEWAKRCGVRPWPVRRPPASVKGPNHQDSTKQNLESPRPAKQPSVKKDTQLP